MIGGESRRYTGLWLAIALYFARMSFVTAGYHPRYFSHRSFKTSRIFQAILAFGAQTFRATAGHPELCEPGVPLVRDRRERLPARRALEARSDWDVRRAPAHVVSAIAQTDAGHP